MNSKLLPAIFFGLLFPLLISAQIKFDTTVFDYGQITQGGEILKDIKFTNTGKEPLIIQRASTGDGGSFADYPKEPIAPGRTGMIRFHYDSNRIGPFNREIYVSYVSGNSYEKNVIIMIKGEVIYNRTQMHLTDSIKNIGDLHYGELDTIQFTMSNSGDFPLHIYFNSYDYPESDLLSTKIESKDSVKQYPSRNVFVPNERVCVRFVIRNIYGNTGNFDRKLFIHYNSHDSLLLRITGNFNGGPEREKIVEGGEYGNTIFYYEKDKLVKKEIYNGSEVLSSEEFYEGSYCIHKIKYWWPGKKSYEIFYQNGMIISKQYFNEGE